MIYLTKLFQAVFLAFVSMSALATESFWVLGSFAEEASATQAGKRISSDSGIEVLLHEVVDDEGLRYRLLTGIPDDEIDQSDLKYQLARAGIQEVWTVSFEEAPFMQSIFASVMIDEDLLQDDVMGDAELAEIDAMLADMDDDLMNDDIDDDLLLMDMPRAIMTEAGTDSFVVAGSFKSAESADALLAELQSAAEQAGHGVEIRASDVSGSLFYRVLIGPVLASEERDVIELLAEQGVSGAWVLSGVKGTREVGTATEQDISTPLRGLRVPGNPRAGKKFPGEDSDFNLARLKRKPASQGQSD